MKETLSFLEKREYSILERRPSSQRMREREEAPSFGCIEKRYNKKKNKKQKQR